MTSTSRCDSARPSLVTASTCVDALPGGSALEKPDTLSVTPDGANRVMVYERKHHPLHGRTSSHGHLGSVIEALVICYSRIINRKPGGHTDTSLLESELARAGVNVLHCGQLLHQVYKGVASFCKLHTSKKVLLLVIF